MEWVFFILGVILGGGLVWFLTRRQSQGSLESLRGQMAEANRDALDVVRDQLKKNEDKFVELRERHEAVIAEHAKVKSQLESAGHELAAKEKFVEESKKALENTFSALSRDALALNRKEFIRQAQERLDKLVAESGRDLKNRQEAIDSLLKPLNKALDDYQKQSRRLETSLKEDYGSLKQQLETVATSTKALTEETANLGQALRTPQVRGKWGELTLRNVAEIAGMSEYCDFVEQESVETEEGRQRPDMIVRLPGGRKIVVDSKVPLVAFLDAIEAPNDEERRRHLERHTRHVKTHMRQLSGKAYWKQFEVAPDFVVMFIPGESFFSAAVDVDHGLIEEGMRSNVILASPTTFVALLRAVAMGWRQEQLARNALEISRLGSEIHERIAKFVEHFLKVGKSLDQATAAYNSSVGTLESRVLVSARRFKELGTTTHDDLPEITPIDRTTRPLQTDLLTEPDHDGAGDGA